MPVVTVTGRSRMLYQSTVADTFVPVGTNILVADQRTLSNGTVTVIVKWSNCTAAVGSVTDGRVMSVKTTSNPPRLVMRGSAPVMYACTLVRISLIAVVPVEA